MKEKFLSILLTLCMALSLLPATAWAEDADGASSGHTNHCVCGATHHEIGDHTAEKILTWTAWNETTSLPTDAGYYYLTDNVTLSKTWEPSRNVNGVFLCLNGKEIKANGDFDVITVNNGRTFTLTDCQGTGKITHTSGKTGRGVYVYDNGSIFNMYGGNITGNITNTTVSTKDGGGVHVSTYFNMYGGKIFGNSANNGGGVYVDCSTFTMNGGEITGNNAGNNGGGVYMRNYDSRTTVKVSGDAKIKDNVKDGTKAESADKYTGDTANNVYLNTAENKISIERGLTENARIGVTTKDTPPATFSTNAFYNNVDYTKIFTSDDDAYKVVKSDSNLQLVPDRHEDHCICGATHKEVGDHKTVEQTTFETALKMDSDGNLYKDGIVWEKNSYEVYKLPAGKYYLDSNITVDKPIFIDGSVILCLNGHSITANGSDANGSDAIKVYDGKSLTLTDCKGGGNDYGKITHAENADGRGVHVYSGATFTMYGGSITGNSATDNGGGVFVESNNLQYVRRQNYRQ